MAHRIYNSDCFIFGGVAVGESNRFLTVWTRELGLVRVIGKSLRTSHSKLKYHLQDYSYSHISLVRGRNAWRVTGAQLIYNFYMEYTSSRSKQLLFTRVCALLSRLLQGEERDRQLFDIVSEGMAFMRTTPLDTDLLRDFEHTLLIRILARLGYVGESKSTSVLLSTTSFSREDLIRTSAYRTQAIHVINKAIEASGL